MYVIFQGSNWWIADKIVGHKTKYFRYILGFLKVNIVWGALLILAHFAYLLLNMRHQMQNVITPGITNIHGTIMTVMIIPRNVSAPPPIAISCPYVTAYMTYLVFAFFINEAAVLHSPAATPPATKPKTAAFNVVIGSLVTKSKPRPPTTPTPSVTRIVYLSCNAGTIRLTSSTPATINGNIFAIYASMLSPYGGYYLKTTLFA